MRRFVGTIAALVALAACTGCMSMGAGTGGGSGSPAASQGGASEPSAAASKPRPARHQMVLVEGGTFQMGSRDGREDAQDVHTVTVSSFYMSEYKVSLNDWVAIIGVWPINYRNCDIWDAPEPPSEYHSVPAFGISWYEAVVYCNKLSVQEGLEPCYASNGSKDAVTDVDEFGKDWGDSTTTIRLANVTCDWNANGYRLPTEAEWEYAARGGVNGSPYKYAGSDDWREVMNLQRPFKMGQKKPNALGLHDMSMGPEWCWDLYSGSYYAESAGAADPRGPATGDPQYLGDGKWSERLTERVQRGGMYYAETPEYTTMVYSRYSAKPEQFEIIMGPIEYNFRVVRNAR